MGSLQNADLNCLIMWPVGTVGYREEQRLVRALNELCQEFGYGRVPQLAAQIEDLWRNPERSDHYGAVREDQLQFMDHCRKKLGGES